MKETKYAGTQTEKNLMTAFAGESEARNKYTYFASKAKKEGYEQIAALFLKTAENEKDVVVSVVIRNVLRRNAESIHKHFNGLPCEFFRHIRLLHKP